MIFDVECDTTKDKRTYGPDGRNDCSFYIFRLQNSIWLFLLERHGDVGIGLRAAGEVGLEPEEAVLQQLPLPVGDVVLQIHVVCPVRHVNLHTGTVVKSVLFIVYCIVETLSI